MNIRLKPVDAGGYFNLPGNFNENGLSDKASCLGMYLYYHKQKVSNILPDDMELTKAAGMKSLDDTISARTELISAGVLTVQPDNTFRLLDDDKLDEELDEDEGDDNAFTPAAFVDFPICLIDRMPELMPEAICVALYLRYFEDYEEAFILPSDAQIGMATGLSTSSAKRARKELIGRDILLVNEDGTFEIDCGIPSEDDHYDDDNGGGSSKTSAEDISAALGLSPDEVKDSLKQLSGLGLIKKRNDGTFRV